jgi:peptidoglycan/LPS O-acetylase OafA/YrhL
MERLGDGPVPREKALSTSGVSRPSARHVTSLDGFRGIAFLLVFARHYSLTSHTTSRVMQNAMAMGQGGWVGVDLFFTLSGLLITGILLDTREQAGYFRKFFARRALRIFPLYYGVLLVLFLLTPVLHLQWRWGDWAYVFYAGNFAYCWDSTLALIKPDVTLMHLWSLAVEEQFYLVWPLVIYLLGSKRAVARVCVSLSLGALVLRAVLLSAMPVDRAYEWSYAMLPTHADGLLYGALAAVAVRSWSVTAIQPIARRMCVAAAAALVGIYAVAGFNFYSRLMILAGFPVLGILFATTLLQALEPRTWASRLGGLRALRFFGKYSYGLYVFHILFSPVLSRFQPMLQRATHSVVLGALVYIGLTFAGTCVMAVLSYQLYESRWLRLKGRFAYARTESAAAVAAS